MISGFIIDFSSVSQARRVAAGLANTKGGTWFVLRDNTRETGDLDIAVMSTASWEDILSIEGMNFTILHTFTNNEKTLTVRKERQNG